MSLKVGQIVKTHTCGFPSLGMIKSIHTAKELHIDNVNNQPFWVHLGSWRLWGWENEPIYKIDFGGEVKLMTEDEWNIFHGFAADYSKCPSASVQYRPAKTVKAWNP